MQKTNKQRSTMRLISSANCLLPLIVLLLSLAASDAAAYFHRPRRFVNSYEIGVSAGISNYFGDLASYYPDPRVLHPAAGLLFRYQYTQRWAFRAAIFHGTISGNDAYLIPKYFMDRNLSFTSAIDEFSVGAEWHKRFFNICRHLTYSPFVFAGLAVFHYNPYTTYNNKKYYLQPLSTEGQGTSAYPDRHPYLLTQVSIPVASGMKIALFQRWVISAEIGVRKTFTDYLDDVSKTYADPTVLATEKGVATVALADPTPFQSSLSWHPGYIRGNPRNEDWYVYSNISVTYIFKSPCLKYHRPKSRRVMYCPPIGKPR